VFIEVVAVNTEETTAVAGVANSLGDRGRRLFDSTDVGARCLLELCVVVGVVENRDASEVSCDRICCGVDGSS